MNVDNDFDYFDEEKVYQDFGVTNGEEFDNLIKDDCLKLPCVDCRNEFEIDMMVWSAGEPYCEDCYNASG